MIGKLPIKKDLMSEFDKVSNDRPAKFLTPSMLPPDYPQGNIAAEPLHQPHIEPNEVYSALDTLCKPYTLKSKS